jgi:DNA-binding IscR family transcriptional regulator
LLDIYRAIHPKRPFEKVRGFPKSTCEEGRRIDKVLIKLFDESDVALEKVLAGRTLADVLDEARR